MQAVWAKMLRKMLRGGFRRKPDSYAYVLTNHQVHSILKAETISKFISRQRLRWIAHVVRMENDKPQKQLLFVAPKKHTTSIWSKLEKETGLDQNQLKRTMKSKSDFDRWLSEYEKRA